jgi:hypothetical protein
MYLITNGEEAESLTKKARDIETKIKSNCIAEDEDQTTNNPFKEEILENIPITELMNHQKATIIYSKSNLNEELDKIIEIYNFIPKIKNHRYATIQINFTKDNSDLILVIDPNIEHGMTFKDVRTLCNTTEIEFKNQSFKIFSFL